MTSWIVLIASNYPQHWKIAKSNGFWDMTSRRDVALGDTVYFWQAGGSILSQCTATSSAYPMTAEDAEPWEDSGEREYVARFHFDCLSESPKAQPRWGELQKQWSKPYPLQLRSFSDPADEAVIAQYFDSFPVSKPFSDAEREDELKRLGFDLRTFALRAIAQRQGQQGFRRLLLNAYGRRCAVTGTSTESVLEAAHIARYLGQQSNKTSNGLLLRADIHTLFDLHRVTVTPSLVARVDPALGTPYVELDGTTVHVPTRPRDQPMAELLADHNAECDWL